MSYAQMARGLFEFMAAVLDAIEKQDREGLKAKLLQFPDGMWLLGNKYLDITGRAIDDCELLDILLGLEARQEQIEAPFYMLIKEMGRSDPQQMTREFTRFAIGQSRELDKLMPGLQEKLERRGLRLSDIVPELASIGKTFRDTGFKSTIVRAISMCILNEVPDTRRNMELSAKLFRFFFGEDKEGQ